MKKNFILAFFILLLCLPACIKNQAPTIQDNKNPFAATGLLAHPNETAEEILWRAESQDPDAITLVITGYTLGIGGFPKDEFLSAMFQSTRTTRDELYTSLFLGWMHLYANYPLEKPNPHECYLASRSYAAPLFKQAGIFDLDDLCADIGYKEDPVLHHDYMSYANDFRRRAIALTDRPATEKEAISLISNLGDPEVNKESVAYFVAYGGNENASIAEQTLNLLKFITQRKTEPWADSLEMQNAATDILMRMSAKDVFTPAALEIIRKAHQGDTTAARQMAENYRTGGMGFPKNSSMVTPWIKRAARDGDRKAHDNYVLDCYTSDPMSAAWKFGHIALVYGSPELKNEFSWIIQEAEKSLSSKERQKLQEDLEKELKLLKAAGYQTK